MDSTDRATWNQLRGVAAHESEKMLQKHITQADNIFRKVRLLKTLGVVFLTLGDPCDLICDTSVKVLKSLL